MKCSVSHGWISSPAKETRVWKKTERSVRLFFLAAMSGMVIAANPCCRNSAPAAHVMMAYIISS